LIKGLSDWLQGFIKYAMHRIAFLTPKIAFSNGIKRILNDLGEWSKSDDKLIAPAKAVSISRLMRGLLIFRLMATAFFKRLGGKID